MPRSRRSGYGIDQYVGDLIESIDTLQLETPAPSRHPVGGAVAMFAAAAAVTGDQAELGPWDA